MVRSSPLRDRLRADRQGAHRQLFEHRHEDAASPAHADLIDALWTSEQRLVVLGFRGFAKSTYAEERVVMGACEGEFKCGLFIGPSETRAAERLISCAVELKMNDALKLVYRGGVEHEIIGVTDTQTKLVLKNGVSLLALGRGQDIRGLKQVSSRPDLVIVDDFEDRDNVLTPEGRRTMMRWFLRELRLACHPRARIIVLATIMHPDCVPLQLERVGWPTRRFPITYLDEAGEEQALWPARFPMSWISSERDEYSKHGEGGIWEMEMNCNAVDEGQRDFKSEYFRLEPRVRTWEPVFVMFDPARTVRASSAATGIVVFSWVGNTLVVWEDRTGFYKPSELIDIMFELDERYSPAAIGVEENGLEEWLLEPIRAAMAKRGNFLPLVPLRAPRDKLSFIRGLEPHARSGEIVFAAEMPDLAAAFAGFPRGRIDGPNALAYATVLRPGIPVYDDFLPSVHVADRIFWPKGEPLYLAMNATAGYCTAALIGHANGKTVIIRDWISEGDPGWSAPRIVAAAGLAAGGRVGVTLPAAHFDQWHNVGLVQAITRIPCAVRQGAGCDRGRDFLRRQLAQLSRDVPAFRVAADARWTLAALGAAYARKPGRAEPEAGFHRTLMEGIEATLALCAQGIADDDVSWSFTADGRRYRKYGTGYDLRVH